MKFTSEKNLLTSPIVQLCCNVHRVIHSKTQSNSIWGEGEEICSAEHIGKKMLNVRASTVVNK